jgi:flagellar biosynthesis/type III secretory pathway protein FliH
MNMNVLLISEDYVRTNSNLNDNVFGKWILPAIREAQEMGLMPIIGECLYKRICEMVDNGDIDKKVYAAYKDLLDEKIQPYLLYQTLTNIVPLLNGKMGNIGTVATNDEHIVTLSQGELDLTQNYYRERADFYAKRLQEWVKANDLAFPELNCGCGNMKPNLERSNNSVGMWLGGARGKKVRSNDCGCKTDAVRPDCPPCPDYDEGYQSGYTSGHTDGYGEGYEDGYDKGQEDCPVCPDCDEAYQNGYTSGHTDGYGEGYDDGYDKGETDGYGEGFESGYTSGHTDGVEVVTTDFLHIDITQNGNYYKVGEYGAYSSITVDVATGSSCDLGELSVQLDTTQDWESGVSFTPEEGDGWSAVTIQDTSYGQEKFTSGYTSGYTEGYDSGYTSGYSSGYTSGDTNGYNRGYSSGWSSGYSSGYTSGYTDGASQQGDLESITFDVTQDTETIYPHSGYIGMSSVVVNAGDFGDGRYAEGYEDGAASMHVQDVKIDTPIYTEGEPYTVTPDFEYDSMASVELDLSDVYGQGYSDGQDYGESLFTDGAIAITATTNGVYTADTENYALFSSVTVDVSGTPCNLEGKSVVLTAATQTVEPSSGYDGMSAVTVDASAICQNYYDSGYEDGEHYFGTEIIVASSVTLNQYGTYYFVYDSATSVSAMTVYFHTPPSGNVEGLKVDGNCWFDTGIVPDRYTKVEMWLYPPHRYSGDGGNYYYIGAQNASGDNTAFKISQYDYSLGVSFVQNIGDSNPNNSGNRWFYDSGASCTLSQFRVSLDSSYFKVTSLYSLHTTCGDSHSNSPTRMTSMGTCDQSLFIGAINCPDYANESYRAISDCVFKEVKIYDDDTLIGDFVPTIHDGQPCFYDSVNDTYIYNSGSGTPLIITQ